ncbi:galactose-1-epimerase [Massilia sp. CCM 8695]|uniref:Aldose 1-epimerase n=1 Tax=Massilia frigida TaxID=2609281 RepID=A0ABX0NAQ3_9BURK|nr:galactose-1-epimerase [Massilia frigida]
MQASITQTAFGHLPDGRAATLTTLTNPNGLLVSITDFGGIITEIHAPDRNGVLADITLGFDSVTPYVEESPYFGALIGRYGNRLRDGRFTLDGQVVQLPVNDGAHHLHGGALGYHRVLWRAIPFQEGESVGVTLIYRSPDGEQGYPGTLDVTVVYELTAADELVVAFDAVTDKATPVNLTQHAYFNLAGGGDILGHVLRIDADAITPIDSTLIPTGELAPVAGSAFDFRTPHAIGERIGADEEQLRHGSGYDHNFVLNQPAPRTMTLAARVHEPVSGRVLELFTEEPGVQFYSGNFLDGTLSGKGRTYGFRCGFCLEPQHFPDSPNQRTFPNTILRPGEEYATVSKYKFSVEK